MTTNEYIALTKELRVWQKKYFAAKPNSQDKYQALDKSKRLEKQVDEALSFYELHGSFTDPQASLF